MKRINIPIKLTLSAVMAMWALHGCTKLFPAELPDGEAESVHSKAELEAAEISIVTSSDGLKPSEAQSVRAENGEAGGRVKVIQVEAPERLKPIFKDLVITGPTEAIFKVKLSVDRRFVTAHKVLPAGEVGINTLERQLAVRNVQTGETLVPIFQYAIEKQGILERSKNELKEETRVLKLKETNPEEATHVQFATLATKRLDVKFPTQDVADRVFSGAALAQTRLLSRADISRLLDIRVALEANYVTRLKGSKLALLQVSNTAQLNEKQRRDLDAFKNGSLPASDVRTCAEDVAALLPEGDRATCVTLLRYEFDVQNVVARRKAADLDGTLSAEIELVDAPAGAAPSVGDTLVRIEKNPLPSRENIEDGVGLDPRKSLPVARLKDAEFLMRRTLQDTPSTFRYTFAGSSGRLEIVRFKFDENRVRVLRADTLLGKDGASNVDHETLISLPAVYLRQVNTDPKGNPLPSPRFVATLPSDPAAIAFVEWSENSVPPVSSPLDFYGLGQCFGSGTDTTISQVDHRLENEGILSFTAAYNFTASQVIDCAGLSEEGYFDTVQRSFTFKERISFKRYERPASEEPAVSVPLVAQKRLGFGLFTYAKKKPDANGNVDRDGTEIPLPAVFDVKGNKKITYVLAGLPTDESARSAKIREQITAATREVIADLNIAFRQALAGTAAERRDDIVELKIEGVDSAAGVLGDLDRNHIFYVQKGTDSGIIGLGGAHSNPRSGTVEAASVFMYGGNMLSMVQTMKERARAARLYREKLKAVAASEGEGEAGATLAPQLSLSLAPKLVADPASKAAASAGKSASLKRFAQSAAKDGRLLPTFAQSELRKLPAGALRLREAFLRGRDAKALSSAHRMAGIVKAVNKGNDPRMSVLERVRAADICVMDASAAETIATSGGRFTEDDVEKMDDIELLALAWKGTLAHELGHNMGLRHNFQGSFDKANWTFTKDEKTTRNYSAIMDYLTDDHLTYDGFGPGDVAGLRAGYAGVLELHPEILALVKDGKINSGAGVSVPVQGGRYVAINDYLKAVGLSSWLELSAQRIGALPVKPYIFCTDEDVGQSPTCNQHDSGSTPEEIVANVAKNYRELYSLRNFPSGRLSFEGYDTGAYIGGLFARFLPARLMLEETFYQLIQGGDYMPYLRATVQAMQFFHSVVASPDASSLREGDARFVKVGKNVIETKWLQDQYLDADNSDRLSVRGVEFDKAIALIMLSQRQWGLPRYERVSLRLAFPDLERFIFSEDENGQPVPAVEQPTLSLFHALLSDQLPAIGVTGAGQLVGMGAAFKADTTELLRSIALMGAMLDLDIIGLESSDNPSEIFRVLNSFQAPSDLPFIQQPGSGARDLKYYAFPEAQSGINLVSQAAVLGILRKDGGAVAPLVQKWASVRDNAEEKAKVEAEIDAKLQALPEAAGPRQMAEIAPTLAAVINVAQQLEAIRDQVDPIAFNLQIESLRNTLETMAKQQPTVGLAVASLSGEALQLAAIDEIKPDRVLGSTEGTIFRNTQVLSDLFLLAHPEYRR